IRSKPRLLGDDWPQFMARPATAGCGARTLREPRVFVPRWRLSLRRTIRILLPVAWRPRLRLSRSACSQIIPARVPWNNLAESGFVTARGLKGGSRPQTRKAMIRAPLRRRIVSKGSNLGGERAMITRARGAAAIVGACLVAGLTSAPAQTPPAPAQAQTPPGQTPSPGGVSRAGAKLWQI